MGTNSINKLLILVHPGSLCDSANINLGRSDANCARDAVEWELNSWQGPLLVLDGDLSDELPYYSSLNSAIQGAITRGADYGIAVRLVADDPEHSEIARDFLRQNGIANDCLIRLTGAWYDDSHQDGCVTDTEKVLKAAGFTNVVVCDSACRVFDESDECELEEEF